MLLNFTVDGTVGARGRVQRCRGSLPPERTAFLCTP